MRGNIDRPPLFKQEHWCGLLGDILVSQGSKKSPIGFDIETMLTYVFGQFSPPFEVASKQAVKA